MLPSSIPSLAKKEEALSLCGLIDQSLHRDWNADRSAAGLSELICSGRHVIAMPNKSVAIWTS
jgi:hypothetical protein